MLTDEHPIQTQKPREVKKVRGKACVIVTCHEDVFQLLSVHAILKLTVQYRAYFYSHAINETIGPWVTRLT